MLICPRDNQDFARELIDKVLNGSGKEKAGVLRQELQNSMHEKASVFRTEETLSEQIEKLKELKERYKNVQADDKGKQFNTELLEVLELGFLLDNAEQLTYGALNRQESRGAHSREDYKNRDDENWLKHTLIYKNGDGVRIDYKPVTLGLYKPKPRVY